MKFAKYLFVLLTATFVYVALSLTVGQNSISCYKAMEEQKRIVSKQKSDLQNINNELTLELTALKKDKAIIAAYARKLDYVADGEKLIKINGLKPVANTLYETGTVVRHTEPVFVSERLCKIAAICAGLLLLIIFLFYDYNAGAFAVEKESKITMIKGIPLYDVQQI